MAMRTISETTLTILKRATKMTTLTTLRMVSSKQKLRHLLLHKELFHNSLHYHS